MSELPHLPSIRTILAATDLSPASIPALHAAAILAKQLDAELHLVHALGGALDPRMDFLMSQFAQRLQKSAQSELERLAGEFPDGAVTAVRVEVKRGNPIDVILEDTRRIQADLLVIGTHGRTALKHLALGAVAEHLAQNAPVDVLLVRNEVAGSFKRLLVGVSRSDASKRAAYRALNLAASMDVERVDMVSAYTVPYELRELLGVESEQAKKFRTFQEEDTIEVASAFQSAGFPGEILYEKGEPVQVILKTVEQLQSELVFIGCHNRPRWTSMLLGDTARVLAHKLPTATWLVRDLPEKHPVRDALLEALALK
ncbi:MAG: universal stress protein [Planctomycetota bacterium]|nr:MAG: universal stress protein [Planctomycetota bacterium]